MYNVGKGSPTYVAADATAQKEVINTQGGTVYYKDEADVDSGDTALEVGKSVQITAGTYFISASSSKIQVRSLVTSSSEDANVADDLTVGGDATITGAASVKGKVHAEGEIEIEGALNHDGTKVGFNGSAPVEPSTVKKAALTANELATELAKMGLVKIEA